MQTAREVVLRENYDFFQEILPDLLMKHHGEYALLHHKNLAGVFATPIAALSAGRERFDDEIFSIQRVIDQPLDLGFLSYGNCDGAAD